MPLGSNGCRDTGVRAVIGLDESSLFECPSVLTLLLDCLTETAHLVECWLSTGHEQDISVSIVLYTIITQ